MWLNALKRLSEEYALLIPLTALAFVEGPLKHSMLSVQISPQSAAQLDLKLRWHEIEAEIPGKLLNNYSFLLLSMFYIIYSYRIFNI